MFKGRIRPFAVASALLAASASSPHAAAAPPRVALVLSESNYPDADRPLKTPVSDGKAVAEALARRGFEVQTAVDAGGPAMADAVRHFLDAIRPGAVAAVYFSGVGIQVAGKNYLVPTDARIWSDADVLRAGTSVDALVRSMADRGARAEVLILDASRRNPFERRFRSVSAGLAALKASPGALTLASAAPGALNEESGDEAVFAAELAKAIETPGIDAEQAFLLCRDQVAARTQSQQNPSVVSGLDVPFSFDPEQAAKPLPPPAVKAGVPPPPPEPAPPPPVKVAALPPPAASTPALDPPPAASAPPAKADVPPAPAPAAADAPKPAAEPAVHGSPPPLPAPPADASPAKASVPPPPASTATAGPAPAAADGSAAAPAPPVKVASLPPNGGAPPSAAEAPAETPMSSLERARQAELDRRIGRNPRDQDALFERGRLLAQHGSYTLALLDFDRAISLAPDDADAFNDRCWTRSMVGQLQTAMDDCDRALKLRPNFADAHDSRGLVQMKRGSAEAALVDYDAAVRLDPKQSSALYGRGIAKLRLGRREAAEKDISDALALDPGVEAEYARYGLK